MSRWRNETSYVERYIGVGAVNTLIGFSVIFSLMGLGLPPFLANLLGYTVGLLLGFFVSKKIVFRSKGHVNKEAVRYISAFLFSWLLNILILQAALQTMQWNSYLAQVFGAVAYTVAMYLLSRWFVFDSKNNSSPSDDQ
jgi:putative flippase GtrA